MPLLESMLEVNSWCAKRQLIAYASKDLQGIISNICEIAFRFAKMCSENAVSLSVYFYHSAVLSTSALMWTAQPSGKNALTVTTHKSVFKT